MKQCTKHKYQYGVALSNFLTNGRTTISSRIQRGEGLWQSTEFEIVPVNKCVLCGHSIVMT